MPAAGYRWFESLYGVGSDGFYWSRTLDAGEPSRAFGLYFYWGDWAGWDDGMRLGGFAVRAVRVS